MSDDPYRRRCSCGALTSKDRFGEGKPNCCYMCQAYAGKRPPGGTPIAAHRYRPTTTRMSEAMVLEQEDGS